MTLQDLKAKTSAELRQAASEIEGLEGTAQLRRGQLIAAICRAKDIDASAIPEPVDIPAIKQQIGELQKRRDAALESHDAEALRRARRRIHRLKSKLRRAAV